MAAGKIESQKVKLDQSAIRRIVNAMTQLTGPYCIISIITG